MGKRIRSAPTKAESKDKTPLITALHVEPDDAHEQNRLSSNIRKICALDDNRDDTKMGTELKSPCSNPAKRTRSKTIRQFVRSPRMMQSPPSTARCIKSSTPKDGPGVFIDLPSPGQNTLFTMSTPIRHHKKCKLQDSLVLTPPLKDDILLSQAEFREVVWDCNSPDAIKRFNQMCLHKLPPQNRENEIRDLVNGLVDGAKVVPSCSSTLMDIWNDKDEKDIKPRQVKKKGRGKVKSSKPNVLSKDLMDKLADIIKLQEESTKESKRSKSSTGVTKEFMQAKEPEASDDNTGGTQPLSYIFGKGSVDLPSPQSTMVALSQLASQLSQSQRKSILEQQQQRCSLARQPEFQVHDDAVENGIAPLNDDDDVGWESDDLFNDESLIKATQELFDDIPAVKDPKSLKRKSGNIRDLTDLPVKRSGRTTFSLDCNPYKGLKKSSTVSSVSNAKSDTNCAIQKSINEGQCKPKDKGISIRKELPLSSTEGKRGPLGGMKEHIKPGKRFTFKNNLQSAEMQNSKTRPNSVTFIRSGIHSANINSGDINKKHEIRFPLQHKTVQKIQPKRNESSKSPAAERRSISVVDKTKQKISTVNNVHSEHKSSDWNDNSLTDDLLFQLAEPDEALDSQIGDSQVLARLSLSNAQTRSNAKAHTVEMKKHVAVSKQKIGQFQHGDNAKKSGQTLGKTVARVDEYAASSSDPLLCDDVLSEPQVLAMLDQMESQATQAISQSRCTAAEIERKRQAALKKKQEKLQASQLALQSTKRETVSVSSGSDNIFYSNKRNRRS